MDSVPPDRPLNLTVRELAKAQALVDFRVGPGAHALPDDKLMTIVDVDAGGFQIVELIYLPVDPSDIAAAVAAEILWGPFLHRDDGRPALVASIFRLGNSYHDSAEHPAWRQGVELVVGYLRAKESPFYFQPRPRGDWDRDVPDVIVPVLGEVKQIDRPWLRPPNEPGPRSRRSPLSA
jgi:hypothetical protein